MPTVSSPADRPVFFDEGPSSGIFGEPPEDAEDLFSSIFEGIGDFEETLNRENQQFFDNPEFGRLRGFFNEQVEGRDPVIEAQRSRRLGEESEFFGRRGTEGSTAALNQSARTGSLFDERQVAGRNQALQNLQGLETSRLGFVQQGLENAGVPAAIATALLQVLAQGDGFDPNSLFPQPERSGPSNPLTSRPGSDRDFEGE